MKSQPIKNQTFIVFLDGDESNKSVSNVITEDIFYEEFSFLNFSEIMDMQHALKEEITELQAQLQFFRNLHGVGVLNDIKHFH
jgi:hypothetical protein